VKIKERGEQRTIRGLNGRFRFQDYEERFIGRSLEGESRYHVWKRGRNMRRGVGGSKN